MTAPEGWIKKLIIRIHFHVHLRISCSEPEMVHCFRDSYCVSFVGKAVPTHSSLLILIQVISNSAAILGTPQKRLVHKNLNVDIIILFGFSNRTVLPSPRTVMSSGLTTEP